MGITGWKRLSEDPESTDTLPFAKGVRWITGKSTETDATKKFREYLRFNIRLGKIQHRTPTAEQMTALFQVLPEGSAKEAEDAEIERIEAQYRSEGFSESDLRGIREAYHRLQKNLVQPFRNAEKGKKGGRPRGSKKVSKKPLEHRSARRN